MNLRALTPNEAYKLLEEIWERVDLTDALYYSSEEPLFDMGVESEKNNIAAEILSHVHAAEQRQAAREADEAENFPNLTQEQREILKERLLEDLYTYALADIDTYWTIELGAPDWAEELGVDPEDVQEYLMAVWNIFGQLGADFLRTETETTISEWLHDDI